MKNYPVFETLQARTWPTLAPPADLQRRLVAELESLSDSHTTQLASHEALKPNSAAATAEEMIKWDTEKAALDDRHHREQTEVKARHDEICKEMGELPNYFAGYGRAVSAYNSAVSALTDQQKPLIEKAEKVIAEFDNHEQGLRDQQTAILSLLAAEGISTDDLGEDFQGLNEAMETHYYSLALKARAVDPNKPPEEPIFPVKPDPAQPSTQRVLIDNGMDINWTKLAGLLAFATVGCFIDLLLISVLRSVETTPGGALHFQPSFYIIVLLSLIAFVVLCVRLLKPLQQLTADPEEKRRRSKVMGGDIALIIGGLMVGASAGAAIGGIHTTSDGVQITPLFWFMLIIGTFLATMMGKKLFPPIAGAITLTCITEEEVADPTRRQQRTMRNAWLTLGGIFFLLCSLDYFGWWRYANEANAAHAGDLDTWTVPAVPAGLVMMCVSAFLLGSKFAALYSHGKQLREEILQEIELVQHRNNEITRQYDETMRDYRKEKAAYDQYFTSLEEAKKNAAHRAQTPHHGLGDTAVAVHTYRLGRADIGKKRLAALRAQENIESILANVKAELRPAYEAVKADELRIDNLYKRVNELPH